MHISDNHTEHIMMLYVNYIFIKLEGGRKKTYCRGKGLIARGTNTY